MMKNYKKLSGSSLVIFVLGIMTIFAFAGLVIDLGMVMITQQELQKAAETSVLAGTTNLETTKSSTTGIISINTSNINTVTDIFNKIKASNPLISAASITNVTPVISSKAVGITVSAEANLYFMSVLGLRNVNVLAQAAAMSDPFYLSPFLPRVPSVGSVVNISWGNRSSLYGYPDGNGLRMKQCGYTSFRLPVPIVDQEGAELYVKEAGFVDGYFVYIGVLDQFNTPYLSDIRWVNVSCTGIPASGAAPTDKVGPYLVDVIYGNNTWIIKQAKFYGSGYFDIGKRCYDPDGNLIYDGGAVKNATQVKIVDDCVEDGFNPGDLSTPVAASTDFPGADIDAFAVLHHSRLIKYRDISQDDDNDGLIDILEDTIGTDKDNSDTDGDGIPDGSEYVGWHSAGHTPITTSGATQVYFTNPKVSDHP